LNRREGVRCWRFLGYCCGGVFVAELTFGRCVCERASERSCSEPGIEFSVIGISILCVLETQ
jgi:hypothetical protein